MQLAPDITLSIVSHAQFELVRELLGDIARHCAGTSLEVILTVNVPESLPTQFNELPFPLRVIHNTAPLGFAHNHNRAVRQACGALVCILNPDVRIASDVFTALAQTLADPTVGLVAPLVLDAQGKVEDSARRFPMPWNILLRALGASHEPDWDSPGAMRDVDWVGGMFMMLRRDAFKNIGEFDERYFLYYEDVDLCVRLWAAGLRVTQVRRVSVTHLARRSSHRSLRYLAVHIASMCRYFLSASFLSTVRLSFGRFWGRRP